MFHCYVGELIAMEELHQIFFLLFVKFMFFKY
jgi:hypothetical protein